LQFRCSRASGGGSPFGGADVFQVVVPLLAVQPCKEQSQQLMN